MMEEDGIALFLSEAPFFDNAFTALESPLQEINTEMYALTDPMRPCPVTRQLVFYPVTHSPIARDTFDTVNHDFNGLQPCIEVLQLDTTIESEEMDFALCDDNHTQTAPVWTAGAYDLEYAVNHDLETCSNVDGPLVFEPEPSMYKAGTALGMLDHELALPFYAPTNEATQPQHPPITYPLHPYYERESRRAIPRWEQVKHMKSSLGEEAVFQPQSLWNSTLGEAIIPLQLGYHSRAPSGACEARLPSPCLTETRYENKNEAVFTRSVG